MKFRGFSYFAQLTPIVSCFRKYHSKVLKRFSFFEFEESSKIAIQKPTGTLNLKSKLQFSKSPYSIAFCVKVFSVAWKKCPVERHQREVHFGAFVMSETNMELVQ